MRDRIRPTNVVAWLKRRDPQLLATHRAVRAALVLPALLAVCGQVLHSPPMATFAAFGAFSMLLLVEFSGSLVERIRAQVGFAAVWAVLISLGTLVAGTAWLAVCLTVVVVFVFLFSGVVSFVLAGAGTALLMGFILPVTSPAPLSDLPARLAGVGLASAASILTTCVLWPRKTSQPLRLPAARVCASIAVLVRAEVRSLGDRGDQPTSGQLRAAVCQAASAAEELRHSFVATNYRPTGLSVSSRAVVRLVDELGWLGERASDGLPDAHSGRPACDDVTLETLDAIASVLEQADFVLRNPTADHASLVLASANLRTAVEKLETTTTPRFSVPRRRSAESDGRAFVERDVRAFVERTETSFRSQELAFAALHVADNVVLASLAEGRPWHEQLLGRMQGELVTPAASARERASAHFRWRSVWMHNSLRGALAMGIAVALVNVTSVQHSFWVLLGTLVVLGSNAVSTGRKAVRAVVGTAAGSLAGLAVLLAVGHHVSLLWLALPLAVIIAGIAPTAVSFVAGQAAFTLLLIILVNTGKAPDWHSALVRLEDVGIGCVVGILVGLVFWPRGAAAEVDRALADAYAKSATYLGEALEYAGSRFVRQPVRAGGPLVAHRRAAAASRRLDDAFRNLLSERGPQPPHLPDVVDLVMGVATLRMTADAVTGLWEHTASQRTSRENVRARQLLLDNSRRVTRWYLDFSESFDGTNDVPSPLPDFPWDAEALVESVGHELREDDPHAADSMVRLMWTVGHLRSACRLQAAVAAAATSERRL
ncbi:FUSC family protein [Streptomyces sp. NPDC096934]|uniref:FUSC family protein n=1 Tax=Streptomyces sp. NPDC096934 TaxID=3155551 RepID=UPI0033313756